MYIAGKYGNKIKSEDDELRQEKAVPGTGSTGLESGNAASMALAVRYGEFMLLTGDVEGEVQNSGSKAWQRDWVQQSGKRVGC